MYAPSIPPTTIYGTWVENVEITSADDEGLVDMSALVEITLKLRDPRTGFDELVLLKSLGDITLPSLGIIEWRVEATRMGALRAKLYEVILLLDDGTTVVVMILGSISILE